MLKAVVKQTAYWLAPRWAAAVDQRRWLARQARLLRERWEACVTLGEKVDLALTCAWFRPSQKRSEILQLLALLAERRPRLVCEIGSYGGGTLGLLGQVAAPDAEVLSIDLAYTLAQMRSYPELLRPGQRLTCLAADSHAPETLVRVREWLDGRLFDFVFIDGDHALTGVAADYEAFAPLVRPGGLIGFHDIVPDFRTRYGLATASDVGEVPRFWAELRRRHPAKTCELIDDPAQDGYGIGLLFWEGRVG
jgi:predicted O-methyltransferase YrrM